MMATHGITGKKHNKGFVSAAQMLRNTCVVLNGGNHPLLPLLLQPSFVTFFMVHKTINMWP